MCSRTLISTVPLGGSLSFSLISVSKSESVVFYDYRDSLAPNLSDCTDH